MSHDSQYDRPRTEGERDPHGFFEERGYVLVPSEADGVSWVDLLARDNPEFRLVRFGRGDDPERAAYAAMRRWIVEQGT